MSSSKMGPSVSEETNENCPDNYQDVDIEDRYVMKQCAHDVSENSVRISHSSIHYEEMAEEEYLDLEEATNKEELDDSFGANSFTDAECGEPMHSQFLRLDFTPVDGIDDNPHLQKKCSDFWEFICKQPQLEGLMVMPEKNYEEVVAASSSETSVKKCKNIPTPALGWLKTGVGHELAFAVKHQSKYCDRQNKDYLDESQHLKNRDNYRHKNSFDRGNLPQHDFITVEHPVAGQRRFYSPNALDLCTQLDEWDRKHPKPMDPPGRVPNLTHAIMQRKKQER